MQNQDYRRKKQKHGSLKKMDLKISHGTRKLSLIPECKKIIKKKRKQLFHTVIFKIRIVEGKNKNTAV